MKEFWNTIQLIFAGIGGWLGYFLGMLFSLLLLLQAAFAVGFSEERMGLCML